MTELPTSDFLFFLYTYYPCNEINLNPNFDDVSVLHVELSWCLAVFHFAAIEVEAYLTLSVYRHPGQVLGEDRA